MIKQNWRQRHSSPELFHLTYIWGGANMCSSLPQTLRISRWASQQSLHSRSLQTRGEWQTISKEITVWGKCFSINKNRHGGTEVNWGRSGKASLRRWYLSWDLRPKSAGWPQSGAEGRANSGTRDNRGAADDGSEARVEWPAKSHGHYVAEQGPSHPKPLSTSSNYRRPRYHLGIGMPLIFRSLNKLSDFLKTLGQAFSPLGSQQLGLVWQVQSNKWNRADVMWIRPFIKV